MIRFELVSAQVVAAVGTINETIVRAAAGPSFAAPSRQRIHFASVRYPAVLAASRASVVSVDPLSSLLQAVARRASEPPKTVFDESRLTEALRARMMPHQREGIRAAVERHALLLADDMGMGKTLQGLGAITHTGEPAVVITKPKPASQWASEAAKWAGHLRVVVVTSGDQVVDYDHVDVVVVSYDLVGSPRKRKYQELFVERAQRWGWIVADECHALKHRGSQRTTALLPVLTSAKRVLLITAKPMGSRPAEAWTLLKVLFRHDMLDWFSYATRYCAGVSRFGRLDARGISNADELAVVFESCMLRRYQDALSSALPPMRLELLFVELPASALGECRALAAEYERARDHHVTMEKQAASFGGRDERANDAVEAAANRMKQLRSAAYVAAGTAKAPYVARLCAEMAAENVATNAGGKTIVFTHHVAVRGAVARACRATPGLDAAEIGGETSHAERRRVVEGLRSATSPLNVGALAFGACAEGLDLTPEVTLVIEAELPWNDDVAAQALRRIHRIGQTKPVRGVLIVARGTVDEVVLRSLRAKRRRAVTVVGAADEDARWTFDAESSVVVSEEEKVNVVVVPSTNDDDYDYDEHVCARVASSDDDDDDDDDESTTDERKRKRTTTTTKVPAMFARAATTLHKRTKTTATAATVRDGNT